MAFLLMTTQVSAQESVTDRSLYVVIGAFAIESNSIEFTEKARKNGYPAESFLQTTASGRQLFFVYVLRTDDRLAAISEAVKLQRNSPYPDTWIYGGLKSKNPEVVKINEREEAEALERLAAKGDTVVTENKFGKSKAFLFRVTALISGDTLPGDVDIFDGDAARNLKAATYRGNDIVQVKPINESGSMMLSCVVFGYRKLQMPVNFNIPDSSAGVVIKDDVVIVPFMMVRLKKGDIATMYNLYFFNDAAIMRPESLSEVNSLVQMMEENPKYKIRIHGHTNGNGPGKIVYKGNSDSFFSFNKDNKEGRGPAKKLSEERAKLILQYLVHKGIAADRMETKAWGGTKPIYEEDHVLARINIRVEIEILED